MTFEEGVARTSALLARLRDMTHDICVVRAIFYNMRDAAAHGAEIVVVPHDKGGTAGRGGLTVGRYASRDLAAAQKIVQLSFPFFHPLRSPETFQVGLTRIGDDTVGGEGIFTIAFDLLLVVGAHFDDGELGIFFYGENSERDADVVVQVALGSIGDVGRGQDGVHQLLGGCLSVAARDGDKRDIELLTVIKGQLLQGGERVFHQDQPVGKRACFHGSFVDDGIGSASFQGLCGKGIAVEVGTFQCKKEVALPELAGIGLHGWVLKVDLIELGDGHGQIYPSRTASPKIWPEYAGCYVMNILYSYIYSKQPLNT